MPVDVRSRMTKDVRAIGRDEIFDHLLPDAIASHGELAARGVWYRQLPSLGLDVDGRLATLGCASDTLALSPGTDAAGVTAALSADALSDLVQDLQSAMGLAMTSRVKITRGNINDWIGWEPALRALLDGRKVHEDGDVAMVGLDGEPLDLDQTFTVDADHDEMARLCRPGRVSPSPRRLRRVRNGIARGGHR